MQINIADVIKNNQLHKIAERYLYVYGLLICIK